MRITYFFQRANESLPLITALRENNIYTEIIQLSNNNFSPIRNLKKLKQAYSYGSYSYIILDDPGVPSTIINFKKFIKLNTNGYLIRLRGDAIIETSGFGRSLVDLNIKGSNLVLHVSDYLKNKYEKIYPYNKHLTLYNGIDLNAVSNNNEICVDKYLKHIKKAKTKILIVMNFEYREKIRFFFELPKKKKKIIEEYSVILVIIGGGKYLSIIKSIFSNIKEVVFLGRINRSEVLKLMSYFDIFYYPSGLDALPNVLLEASASGLPIIANSIGGIPEIVLDKKTGFLMEDVEKDGYKYLKLLIEDEDLRNKMSICGKKYVAQKFNWNVIKEKFIKIIKSELS
jgi:glycosyltransferase involved in cell wall biosynthesis